MKNSTKALRSFIGDVVRRQLTEAKSKRSGAPKSFAQYRKLFGSALRDVKAPKNMVSDVSDVSYEGGSYFDPLWRSWEAWESESDKSDESWKEHVGYFVHDAVIDMYSIAGGSHEDAGPDAAKRVVSKLTTGDAGKPAASSGSEKLNAKSLAEKLAKHINDAIADSAPGIKYRGNFKVKGSGSSVKIVGETDSINKLQSVIYNALVDGKLGATFETNDEYMYDNERLDMAVDLYDLRDKIGSSRDSDRMIVVTIYVESA